VPWGTGARGSSIASTSYIWTSWSGESIHLFIRSFVRLCRSVYFYPHINPSFPPSLPPSRVDILSHPDRGVLRATVRGSIECRCYLSGMPEVRLGLAGGPVGRGLAGVANGKKDEGDDDGSGNDDENGDSGGNNGVGDATDNTIAFHPCVDLGRFASTGGEATFVPPDGAFTLCRYRSEAAGAGVADANAAATRSRARGGADDGDDADGVDGPVALRGSAAASLEAFIRSSAALGPAAPLALGAAYRGHRRGRGARVEVDVVCRARLPRGDADIRGAGAHEATPHLDDVVIRVPVPPATAKVAIECAGAGKADWTPGEDSIRWRVGRLRPGRETAMSAVIEQVRGLGEGEGGAGGGGAGGGGAGGGSAAAAAGDGAGGAAGGWRPPPLRAGFTARGLSASGLRVAYLRLWERGGLKADTWVRRVARGGEYAVRPLAD